MLIRRAAERDLIGVYELYEDVIGMNGEFITPYIHQISFKYIVDTFHQCEQRGLALVVEESATIVAFLKGFTSQYNCLTHLMDNVTILVSSKMQGKGYGSALMSKFLEEIALNFKHIQKVELITQHRNPSAIAMYKKVGFTITKTLEANRMTEPQVLQDCYLFEWKNHEFSKERLKEYQDKLGEIMRKKKQDSLELLEEYKLKWKKQ